MPRRSASDALLTRDAIVNRAVDVASVDGLEGVTIGRLATDLTMSKAGVIGHFGTKETLQLAALDAAIERFRVTVWEPVAHREPGIERLRALCDSWQAYCDSDTFPGGCFLTAASFEFDDREGPVRDKIAGMLKRWHGVLRDEVATAVAAGDLPKDTDPDQVAFELEAITVGANQARRLHRDPQATTRANRAIARVLQR
ncbi:MAG TPA: TetR/AcrR family transcriptional regulator [Solirubrobacteraceae bacterium]